MIRDFELFNEAVNELPVVSFTLASVSRSRCAQLLLAALRCLCQMCEPLHGLLRLRLPVLVLFSYVSLLHHAHTLGCSGMCLACLLTPASL